MFSSIPLKFLLILFMYVNYVWTEDDFHFPTRHKYESCVNYSSVVKIKISHRILPSPAIPEDDLPGTAKSREMTYRGLANSGLRQAGIGQIPLSHLPAPPNHGRWLTGAWQIPAYDKPGLARPR